MNKLDLVIYNKLLLQAEEAKDQGMIKLAEVIMETIGPEATIKKQKYAYSELEDEVYKDIWKFASKLIIYHDLKSADALKIDETVKYCTSKILDELETMLNVENVVKGPLEPKIPGETK